MDMDNLLTAVTGFRALDREYAQGVIAALAAEQEAPPGDGRIDKRARDEALDSAIKLLKVVVNMEWERCDARLALAQPHGVRQCIKEAHHEGDHNNASLTWGQDF